MKYGWMVVILAGAALLAQAQNPPAPAADRGRDQTLEAPPDNPDGNALPEPSGGIRRDFDARRLSAPRRPGPGEEIAASGAERGPARGEFAGPEGSRVRMEDEGPGRPGDPVISFDQGGDPDEMEGPEDTEETADGPEMAPPPMLGRGFGPRLGMPFGPSMRRGAFGFGMPPSGQAFQAALGLDDGQVQTLRTLRLDRAVKLIEAQRQLEHRQVELMDMLEQENPDGAALVSNVKAIHSLRKQATEIEQEFQAKTAAALNDEQRAKLKSMQAERPVPGAWKETAAFVRPGHAGRTGQFDGRPGSRRAGGPGFLEEDRQRGDGQHGPGLER